MQIELHFGIGVEAPSLIELMNKSVADEKRGTSGATLESRHPVVVFSRSFAIDKSSHSLSCGEIGKD